MPFEVKLDIYEGPIGLLLSLIQAKSLDVYQLSITQLVQDYLEEIERMNSLDLEVATEFILVAATLLDIKCRKLFPRTDDGESDDDLAFFEERDLLLARLLECKTYRDVSVVLAKSLERGMLRRPRTAGFDEHVRHLIADPLDKIFPSILAKAYMKALELKGEATGLTETHVTPLPRISVQSAKDRILSRLDSNSGATFDDICLDLELRMDVVVFFLALLDLVRQGIINVNQKSLRDPIEIELSL